MSRGEKFKEKFNTTSKMAGAKTFIDKKILQRKIVLFSKSYSPECQAIKTMINEYAIPDSVYEVVEIEKRQDCTQMETYFQVLCLTNARAVSI